MSHSKQEELKKLASKCAKLYLLRGKFYRNMRIKSKKSYVNMKSVRRRHMNSRVYMKYVNIAHKILSR